MPVPNTAELIKHSATAFLTLAASKSSVNFFLKNMVSCLLLSTISSAISNHLPLPNVASSNSATLDSTACCKAGDIIRERSEALSASAGFHCPRQSL